MPFGCQTVQGKITDVGYGGFSVKPNGRVLVGSRMKTYIIRIIAQVDNDCTIELNNNELSGGRNGWITSNQGTGKYEEYIGYWTYGNGTANPDSIGFVYVKPKDGKGRGAGRWFIWVTTVEVYESNAYDNSIATVKSSITQLSNSIDMKVANATNGLSSRITQLDNAIKAQVIDGGKVMSALTLYNGGARIDGKLLHVTGKSLFDDNIVTNKMIQANAVTADKLSVGSLSAITANVGTLRGGELIGTTIRNENNTFSVDSQGNIRGARIDADSFRRSGLEITAIKVEYYTVADESRIPVPWGYSFNDCEYVVLGVMNWTNVASWRNNSGKFDDVYNKLHNRARLKAVGVDSAGKVYDGEESAVGITVNGDVIVKQIIRTRTDTDNHTIRNATAYTGSIRCLCIAVKR